MQMKKIGKEEKGSMAVYVTIVLLTFLIMLTALYSSSAATRKAQLKTVIRIKEAYEANYEDIETIYKKQLAKLETDDTEVSEYITDGLLLHYDGINNTGNGHDSTTTTWVDLSGNGNDATITGGTWENNSVKFTVASTENGIKTNNNFPLNFSQTMNVVFKYTEIDGIDPVLGSRTDYTDGFFLWNHTDNLRIDTKGESTRISVGSRLDANTDYNITVTFSGTDVKVYRNGVLDTTTTFTTASLDFPLTIFTAAEQSNSLGNVYSVKVYNRALTDAEVLQNYKMDKVNYGF